MGEGLYNDTKTIVEMVLIPLYVVLLSPLRKFMAEAVIRPKRMYCLSDPGYG